jgi:hypothetical protein
LHDGPTVSLSADPNGRPTLDSTGFTDKILPAAGHDLLGAMADTSETSPTMASGFAESEDRGTIVRALCGVVQVRCEKFDREIDPVLLLLSQLIDTAGAG